ncbi:hypothetical protein [Enterobacter quasiroggenkampii]|uniref:hypothetical protein n=1 Tax=Enterobacter quasiroggenkampii TaxID=2497436 RepID=UPI0039C36E14
MKLIDILVQELPKVGGWPNHVVVAISIPSVSWGVPPWGCSPMAYRLASHEIVTLEQYEAALVASKPEWDGRGLPPSGVEFEYLRGDFGADEGRWVKCIMKYAGDRFCIVHLDGEGESWLKHEGTKIRPIRSEADKKRDEAIESIKAMLMYDYGDDPRLNDAVILYDAIAAGKIPHIRID